MYCFLTPLVYSILTTYVLIIIFDKLKGTISSLLVPDI